MVTALIASSFLVTFRGYVPIVFTNDVEVIAIAKTLMPILATFCIFDAMGAVGGGILRGQGRQRIGGMVNILSYYCIGLPIGLTLTFKLHWGLQGLWTGLCTAVIICSCLQVSAIVLSNWHGIIERSKLMNTERA